jgi:hypothetical protein
MKFKEMLRSAWVSLKPFLIFLLIASTLLSIALVIISLVWFFDNQNIAFIILAVLDLSVLGIFAIGFVVVALQYIFTLLFKKEEIKCTYCGKTILVKDKICPHCGNKQ